VNWLKLDFTQHTLTKSPITKLQIPNKFQYSITNHQTNPSLCLVIEIWLLVIVWLLYLGY